MLVSTYTEMGGTNREMLELDKDVGFKEDNEDRKQKIRRLSGKWKALNLKRRLLWGMVLWRGNLLYSEDRG
jgi:hypothetical protein